MMKRVILLIMAAMTMYACSQQNQTEVETTVETREISELVSEPMAYEDQVVRFEGMISHICRHSGDKMRIVQTSDEAYSLMVMLGDKASEFNPEMEGYEVILTGTLKTRLMNADLVEEDHDHDHGDHEEGHECSSTEEAIRKLQEKGISPDIRAYVELIGAEVK